MSVVVILVLAVVIVTVLVVGIFIGYVARGGPPRKKRRSSDAADADTHESMEECSDLQDLFVKLSDRIAEHDKRVAADLAALHDLIEQDATERSSILKRLSEAETRCEQLIEKTAKQSQGRQEYYEQPKGWPSDGHPDRSARDNGSPSSRGNSAAEDPRGEKFSADDATPEPKGADRRTRKRHPYFCRQWIAPYDGVHLPEAEEFFRVQCHDISSRGIAFVLDRKPLFEKVVVRLAGPSGSKFLTAHVRRVSACTDLSPGWYTLGCEFIDAISSDELPIRLDVHISRKEFEGNFEGSPGPMIA